MKKILYITPHLSTGGAPQYLLKKIELLKNIYNIYVVEYNDYGIYRVQKNRIIDILKDNVFTLGEDKNKIFEMIDDIDPDVIHFEEMPEFFMHDRITEKIYDAKRKYLIYETSHDSSFEPSNKRFLPDKFLFCSDNQFSKFNSLGVPCSVIEYPIVKKISKDRNEGLKNLNLNPEKFHVLNVGLFTPRKNQAEIIEYAKSLIDLPIEFHFVGNMAPNFQSYWEPLVNNMPDNCKIWGERNDVDNFYSCMDLFLFTSRGNDGDKETNPLSIKEALSWKMPTLIYKLDSYQNKLDNRVTYLDDDNFELNKLKILRKLKITEGLLSCELSEESKISLSTGDFFKHLENKLICVFDTKTNLLIYRSNVFAPNLWIKPNCSTSLLGGLNVKIYNVSHDYFSSLSDQNLMNDHHILYEKTFDFSNDVKDITVNGEVKKIKGIDDDPSAWFTMFEVFHQECYKDVQISKGDVVLDVGGHYGLFDLYALNKGAEKIYTFEPAKNTFNILCENLKGYENVKKFNMALSDKNGIVDFKISGSSAVNSFYDSFNTSKENTTTLGKTKIDQVRTMNIETFMKNNDVDRIDVLKLDCEGAEWNIFPTITDQLLKHRIRKITMEVHDFFGDDNSAEARLKRSKDLVDRLNVLGYEVKIDQKIMNGELGNLWAIRRPKIKVVHMLVDVDGEREKQSINHLKQLVDFAGWEYLQMINGKYQELPPRDTCARPDDVQFEPGHYKLTPAHYGNYLAHRNAMEKHLNDDCDAILFCECDAIFIKPIDQVFKQIIDRFDDLTEHNLRYMNFGKRIVEWHYKDVNKYFDITNRMSEAHCYLVPTTSREYFLNKFQNTGWDTYDLWLNNNILNEMVGGITKKPFSIQCSGESYLDKTHKDGTTLLKDGDITYVL